MDASQLVSKWTCLLNTPSKQFRSKYVNVFTLRDFCVGCYFYLVVGMTDSQTRTGTSSRNR